ncbi:Clavaminate synthase-like protein [Cubamyces sp. BRFM 1775]|nr:Clavaminate synthase-like protein [Cubamyces sp. BRFM 1775]
MLAHRALRISSSSTRGYRFSLARLFSCSVTRNTTALDLPTRRVPDVPSTLASSPAAFLEYLRSPAAEPLIFRAPLSENGRAADELLRVLRAAGSDRLVEVEVGRYDRTAGGLNRVEVPLSMYLEWLTAERRPKTTGEGSEDIQLYLAQWRARDEVPGLSELVKTPSLLAPLLESRSVDLYQTSFFIGPSAMVTPLHYDPYFNLYNLYASSEPLVQAKHFVLFPPSLSEFLARAEDGHIMRNTSLVDLHVHKRVAESEALPKEAHLAQDAFVISMDPDSAPSRTRDALLQPGAAWSCVLREGDTLFVPRRWWHRVENVTLPQNKTGATPASTSSVGWTAGVGWWFLPRSS